MVDTGVKPITIKNTGKYAISFKLAAKDKSKIRDLFTCEPASGSIDPGKEATVQVGSVGMSYRGHMVGMPPCTCDLHASHCIFTSTCTQIGPIFHIIAHVA